VTTYTMTTASPVGDLVLASDGESLLGVWFTPHRHGPQERDEWRTDEKLPVLVEARRQLSGYFARDLKAFDLPLAPVGTPFQLDVWAALREIPYGETASYAEIARRVGRPGAFRAVGLANGRNPVSIVVPCHRVIGSGGALTGYGGGMDRKRALLDLEAALLF
jgi:methylated-DNA-[protein]-cysteine S-methyltransferase